MTILVRFVTEINSLNMLSRQATPYLVRPFDWGADIVLHSATKFLCGHGNALAGAIVEKGDFDWGSGKFPILSEPCDSYHGMSFYEVSSRMSH